MKYDFIRGMQNLIQISIHIDPTQIDKNCMDEWGVVTAYAGDDSWGVEYNLCYDHGTCCSAFYPFYKTEDDEYETDTSWDFHYEIDFDDPIWEEKLTMKAASVICEVFIMNN